MLAHRKLRTYYLLLSALVLLFESCELEPDGVKNIIEPQILNYYGFPANTQSVNASIGPFPVSIPDISGYCHFENASIPYDLQVNGGGALYVFNNLSIKIPRIVLPNSEYYSWPNECHLTVKFPPVPQSKAGFLQFISKDIFRQVNGTTKLNPSQSSLTMWIAIPEGRTSIEGKLIFIQGQSSGNHLQSFENFGIKDVTIYSDRIDTVVLTQEEIQFDPPESQVQFNLAYPEPSVLAFFSSSLYFPGFSQNSGLTLMKIRYPSPGPWLIDVPQQLKLHYKIKIRSTYRPDTAYDFHNLEAVEIRYIQPGSSAEIVHNKIQLLGPQNYQHGITKDSWLKVSQDNEDGIYLFAITELEAGPTLAFLTEKNTVRCGELKYRYFDIRRGKSYKWIVYKFSTFNSIDDFTGAPYIFQENFHSVRASEVRYFTTAP